MTVTQLKAAREDFGQVLALTGYAQRTIHYYLCDVERFLNYLDERDLELSPETLEKYEALLFDRLKVTSANRAVIAINRFLRHAGQGFYKMRTRKMETVPVSAGGMSQTEFASLVRGCLYIGKYRMGLILLTIAETGISADALSAFTLEAVESGAITMGERLKQRTFHLSGQMRTCLLAYAVHCGIVSGVLFVNRGGNPLSRSYISAELKSIASKLDLDPDHVRLLQLRNCSTAGLWTEFVQVLSGALA